MKDASSNGSKKIDSLPESEDIGSLERALHASTKAEDIDPFAHERLLLQVLGETESFECTDEELRQAEELRDALEGKIEFPSNLRATMNSLRNAHAPSSIDMLTHERIIRSHCTPKKSFSKSRIVVSALAIAAAFAMMVRFTSFRTDTAFQSEAPEETLKISRSTVDLFDAREPFPVEGGESARLDRIAQVRSNDYRFNRYATWGVRP